MPTIDVSDETFEKIKDQLSEDEQCEINTYDDLIGKAWFFRTVTYHYVGRVTKRIGDFLCLENASWVADSGRFMQAIRDGVLEEVEPLGEWFINLKATTDFGRWRHPLPEKQK